jgi:DNA-binding NtrC family response regulator
VLFLDEIGDLGIDLQVKLLRFLEDHVVFRVGSSQARPVEAQVVAATHRPLKSFVQEGRFREDLYYRLRTVEITVPPLRDRKEDILLLADHFLQLLRRQDRARLLTGFSSSATAALQAYAWPGNARELKAAIEWAVLAGMHRRHTIIELEDLPAELKAAPLEPRDPAGAPSGPGEDGEEVDVERALARAELGCVERALRQCSGRKLEALKLLGYPNRQTMRRRLHNLCERYPDLLARFPETERAYGGAEDLDS